MKLKNIFFVLILISLVAFVSCAKQSNVNNTENQAKEPEYKSSEDALNQMETYTSNATVTYISNKNSNTYETFQYASIDGRYKIQVIAPSNLYGSMIMYDGVNCYQYNPNISSEVYTTQIQNPEKSEILVTSFMKNYETSADTSVSVGNFDSGNYTILEASMSNQHPYMKTEKLWINNETYKPEKLIIYDDNKSERIVVEYTNFEYNVNIDENLFTVK